MTARLSRLLARLEIALDRTWTVDPADAAHLCRCW
jgi:hypothetical protein